MNKFLDLLRRYKDEIGSAAAIIGVCIAALGFWLTVAQLRSTEQTLQATNAYAIQKDARELIDEITQDSLVRALVAGAIQNQSDRDSARASLWKMFNFYRSVFRQSKANGISSEFSASYGSDFCNFLKWQTVDVEWKEMLKMGMLGDGHRSMQKEWCENEK